MQVSILHSNAVPQAERRWTSQKTQLDHSPAALHCQCYIIIFRWG